MILRNQLVLLIVPILALLGAGCGVSTTVDATTDASADDGSLGRDEGGHASDGPGLGDDSTIVGVLPDGASVGDDTGAGGDGASTTDSPGERRGRRRPLL